MYRNRRSKPVAACGRLRRCANGVWHSFYDCITYDQRNHLPGHGHVDYLPHQRHSSAPASRMDLRSFNLYALSRFVFHQRHHPILSRPRYVPCHVFGEHGDSLSRVHSGTSAKDTKELVQQTLRLHVVVLRRADHGFQFAFYQEYVRSLATNDKLIRYFYCVDVDSFAWSSLSHRESNDPS